MKCCPTCGREYPPDIEIRGTVRRRIFDYVAKHPNGVTREQIMQNVYADDPNGGPEHISNVSTQIWFINRLHLRPIGWRIRSSMGRGAIFRLVKL